MKCSIEGCEAASCNIRGWCSKHYKRWTRYGDPLRSDRPANGTAVEFFEETVIPFSGSACLLWPFAKTRGYGVLGKKLVTRQVCERVYGPAPSIAHHAAHSCGNPPCCNPQHLSWKTPKENNSDKIGHGTYRVGERVGTAKLSDIEARSIKAMLGAGLSLVEISKKTGRHKSTIFNIKSGACWAWLD